MGLFDLFSKKEKAKEANQQKRFDIAQKRAMDMINKDKEMKKAHPELFTEDEYFRNLGKENSDEISNGYLKLLKEYSKQYIPCDLNNIQTHRQMIDLLEKVVRVVNYVTMPVSIQHEFDSNKLKDRSIGEFCAEIGFVINKWLGAANIQNIVKNFNEHSDKEMLSAFCYLDFYGHLITEEYRTNINIMQFEIAKEIKKRNIEVVLPKAVPQEISEFEKLQRRCCEIAKNSPNSDELKELKKELWNQLLNIDEMWVAYDEDIAGEFPYVSLMGNMEIFSKEEYAKKAQMYFANNNEGHFYLRKIEKEKIKEWFKTALYIGATMFNLDNGVAPIQFKIEDYLEYDNSGDIDHENRAIRCYLLRTLQAENRYHKMTGEKTEDTTKMYNQIISVLISNGYTALANSTVYALICGPYIEKAKIFSKAAYEKHKDSFKNDSQERQYMIQLDDELKIPAIAKEIALKESVLNDIISAGNVTIFSIEAIKGLQTIVIPNKGSFVPIFTDKAGAEKMRTQLLSYGIEYDSNIVAVTFAEIITSLLTCDGSIVDDTTYSYIIPKATLESIRQQIQEAE